MLKQAKMGVLRLAEATGASRLLSGSAWRRHRLLILCYHGVSMYDEHEWEGLYISPGRRPPTHGIGGSGPLQCAPVIRGREPTSEWHPAGSRRGHHLR